MIARLHCGATFRAAHPFSLRVSRPHIDAPQPDSIVKAFEKAGWFDCLESSDSPRAKMRLKCLESLLQCALTTVQVPPHRGSPTASIAMSASIVDAGVAPSDFALTLMHDGDLRNPNYV